MKKWKKFLNIFISILIFFCLIKLGILIYAATSLKPAIKTANNYSLYDNNSNLIFQGNGLNKWASLEDISQNLIYATISIEDKNFFNHNGFDFPRIIKALLENMKSKKIVQGASTITQQYAKNLFLTFDQSWSRKWEEMWITIKIEYNYSKEEILEGYLNTINYGGVYGIENASHYYFNKSAIDLTLAEATILAGIPNSPSTYSPISNYDKAKQRQNTVLSRMVANNYISEVEKNIAYNEDLNLYGKKSEFNLNTLMYFQDGVLQELATIDNVPKNFLETGGLKIYTTLDLQAQIALENSINKNITDEEIQNAAVMINPNDGGILALVGGRDYTKTQYNRALLSKRQPGSTIKPLLYYAALENGFTASTAFLSQETTFNLSNTEAYTPSNFNHVYGNKAISLAAAIAYSDNIYAVKTHLFLGEDTLVNIAQRLGVKTKLSPVASLPLGSNEINITELVNAYAAFANGGYKVEKHFITKIEDFNGNLIYEYKHVKELVLNPSLVFILSELLAGTYDMNMVDYTYPSCSSIASKLTNKYAVKSGTTSNDVWVIGYNKNVVLGVWSGYDDNRAIGNAAGKFNKYVWADTMESYLINKDNSWYNMPTNVVGVMVDAISGKPAKNNTKNKKVLYYLKGTEPEETDMVFDEILKD